MIWKILQNYMTLFCCRVLFNMTVVFLDNSPSSSGCDHVALSVPEISLCHLGNSHNKNGICFHTGVSIQLNIIHSCNCLCNCHLQWSLSELLLHQKTKALPYSAVYYLTCPPVCQIAIISRGRSGPRPCHCWSYRHIRAPSLCVNTVQGCQPSVLSSQLCDWRTDQLCKPALCQLWYWLNKMSRTSKCTGILQCFLNSIGVYLEGLAQRIKCMKLATHWH